MIRKTLKINWGLRKEDKAMIQKTFRRTLGLPFTYLLKEILQK
jgi:hypothetical protein